jgi:hypothetical protein
LAKDNGLLQVGAHFINCVDDLQLVLVAPASNLELFHVLEGKILPHKRQSNVISPQYLLGSRKYVAAKFESDRAADRGWCD